MLCTVEFFNPAPIGPVRFWIIKYSKFSDSTYSNQIFHGQFLLLCSQPTENVHLPVIFISSQEDLSKTKIFLNPTNYSMFLCKNIALVTIILLKKCQWNAIKIYPNMSIYNLYGVICKNKIIEQCGMHFTESVMICTRQRQLGGFYGLNAVIFSNFVFFYI